MSKHDARIACLMHQAHDVGLKFLPSGHSGSSYMSTAVTLISSGFPTYRIESYKIENCFSKCLNVSVVVKIITARKNVIKTWLAFICVISLSFPTYAFNTRNKLFSIQVICFSVFTVGYTADDSETDWKLLETLPW